MLVPENHRESQGFLCDNPVTISLTSPLHKGCRPAPDPLLRPLPVDRLIELADQLTSLAQLFGISQGIWIQNVHPSPSWLSTPTSPPIA